CLRYRDLHSFPTRRSSDLRHRINHAIEELALSSNYTWLRIPRYLESYLRLNKQYPNIDFRDKELQFLVIRDVIEKDVTLLNILEDRKSTRLNSSHVKISYA